MTFYTELNFFFSDLEFVLLLAYFLVNVVYKCIEDNRKCTTIRYTVHIPAERSFYQLSVDILHEKDPLMGKYLLVIRKEQHTFTYIYTPWSVFSGNSNINFTHYKYSMHF